MNAIKLPVKGVVRQRFLSLNNAWAAESFAADFSCFAARFSFKDLPDFLDMPCRGDLSDIAGPFDCGGLIGPDFLTLPSRGATPPATSRATATKLQEQG